MDLPTAGGKRILLTAVKDRRNGFPSTPSHPVSHIRGWREHHEFAI